MATAILSVLFNGTRRIRVIFTGNLAVGAFASTDLYEVANIDGRGASPISVEAVFAITSTPQAVELSVDSDLAPGALYTVTCTGVPCADSTFFSGSVTARVGLTLGNAPNTEPEQNDAALLLYNRDLAHDGNDFLEDASGDLATSSGRGNWQGAMMRRFGSQGLSWDPTYGAHADQYVDAPDALRQPFAGVLVSQARQDDRTKQATVQVVQAPNDATGGWQFEIEIVGKDELDPLTLPVKPPT